MDYMIKHIGHVKEFGRPEYFPKKIYDVHLMRSDSKDDVVKSVDEIALKYIRYQGMSVRIDPSDLDDPSKFDTERMFVPMSMLSHITAEITPITGAMPLQDEKGEPILASGKDIVKQ